MRATIDGVLDKLSVAPGRGLFRNDDGGDYDKHEWIVLNMRLVAALLLTGNADDAARANLYDWVVSQSVVNANIIAELYDRASDGPQAAAYTGSVPMIGFGAGAYLLSAHFKYAMQPITLPCGGFASTLETALPAGTGTTPTTPGTGSTDPTKKNAAACNGVAGGGPLPWLFGAYVVYWVLLRERRGEN